MKQFEYKGDTLAIIDGEIWLKLGCPADPVVADLAVAPKKRGPKPGATFKPKDKLLEQADVARIKEMINAGYKAQEIATKLGVGAQYVYVLKMQMKRKGELTLPVQDSE